MPLVPLSGAIDPASASCAVLVFSDDTPGGQARSMGLVVDEIVDVVEDHLRMQGGARPGLLRTAIINGAATDVIDIGHYLTLAFGDWFHTAGSRAAAPEVLVVEDSGFFRQMLVPAMAAAGYRVTAVPGAKLRLYC